MVFSLLLTILLILFSPYTASPAIPTPASRLSNGGGALVALFSLLGDKHGRVVIISRSRDGRKEGRPGGQATMMEEGGRSSLVVATNYGASGV